MRKPRIVSVHRRLLAQLGALATVVVIMIASSITSAHASFMAQFPSPTSTVVDSNNNGAGNGNYCCFFNVGDSVTQTFTGTGLASVNTLDLSIPVPFNPLHSGNEVDFNVLLDGTIVGTLIRTSAQGTGTAAFDALFPAISGPGGTYTVEILETNNVPGGGGSIGLNFGTVTLDDVTSVPEPGSLTLIAGGLLGAAMLRRRQKRRI